MQYEPQNIENKMLNFWERNKLVEKSLKLRKGNKTFSFIDGKRAAPLVNGIIFLNPRFIANFIELG